MKHGIAFSDHLSREKLPKRHSKSQAFRVRNFLPLILLSVIFLLLFGRLFFVQVVQGDYYRVLSDSNRIRTHILHAPRGVIFDRNGTPLVFNEPGFRQTVGEKTILLNKEEALARLAKGEKNIEVDSLRKYPFTDAFAHVLGYVGQISKEQLGSDEYGGYQFNDLVGQAGVESSYEKFLKGNDGKQLFEVNAMGKEVRKLGQTDPISGQDITLTIDKELQLVAYQALKDAKRGVVIVSRPNGEILSMVSKPSFDPNLFTLDSTYKTASDAAYTNVTAIVTDGIDQPLLNRAIGGVYPPGSTFKIVTAAAGLENKIIDENYKVTDTGIVKLGQFSFANWFYLQYGRKEPGQLDVRRALSRSNDIYFYHLAQKVTEKKISEMAKKVGSGAPLGIDLDGEVSGLVPNDAWKREVIGEQWYLGDTYHYGIGQGYLLTTPLQVNAWTQVVANGGELYRPRLLLDAPVQALQKNVLNDKTISLIREGMIESCTPKGVAYPLYDFKVKNPSLQIDNRNITKVASGSADMRHVVVACKTGTAQHGGEKTLPHAWITLFAPAYKPEVVVTVLVEESGEGSAVAAPVAKKVLEQYFSNSTTINLEF